MFSALSKPDISSSIKLILSSANVFYVYQSKILSFGRELTLSQTTNFADNNFKFGENGRNFSKCVENTVGKGEIACYKQFLLFPQCFLKIFTADT